VWWVDAAQPARLTLQLARLAEQLGLPARGTADRCAAVLSDLQRRDRWLLIYDNVPDPQNLEGFLPETGRGHVIVKFVMRF
jgi:hypothetical protein